MHGLNFIETLLVIFIISILLAFILPISLDFYKNQQLRTHTQGILQTLRRAQLKTMSVELDSKFGVYIANDNYILFKGNSFAARDIQFDEVFDLPQIITVSGLSEIVFSRLEGKPNITGDIVLHSGNESMAINVNNLGTVSLVPVAPSIPQLTQLHYRWRNDDGVE
ncbi:hypothetical protein IH779_01615 [Patescibacteria group bacterium]|nr:hypothetical protein [Patescibacteria group bacterium]